MQVDPAIGISLVAIDGEVPGRGPRLKHPESTGIAVRVRPPRSAARAHATRSPMPSRSNQLRTWTRARTGRSTWSRPSSRARRLRRQGGHASSGHPGASRRSADVRGLRPGADSSLWTCHGPVRLGGCWLRHHPEPHDAGDVGDPLHRCAQGQCGRAAPAPVHGHGSGHRCAPPGGGSPRPRRSATKAQVHRQFGRIDELGDCMEGGLPAGLASSRTTIVKGRKAARDR